MNLLLNLSSELTYNVTQKTDFKVSIKERPIGIMEFWDKQRESGISFLTEENNLLQETNDHKENMPLNISEQNTENLNKILESEKIGSSKEINLKRSQSQTTSEVSCQLDKLNPLFNHSNYNTFLT